MLNQASQYSKKVYFTFRKVQYDSAITFFGHCLGRTYKSCVTISKVTPYCKEYDSNFESYTNLGSHEKLKSHNSTLETLLKELIKLNDDLNWELNNVFSFNK